MTLQMRNDVSLGITPNVNCKWETRHLAVPYIITHSGRKIEGNNVYPTVFFSKLNRERAYEGRRVLKNSLSDLEKALKNYPVEIPDDPRIWDDDEYDFVTMALPYNEDDE